MTSVRIVRIVRDSTPATRAGRASMGSAMKRFFCESAGLLICLAVAGQASAALSFNFTSGDGSLTSGDAMWQGFQDAANVWSSELTDSVTVQLDIRTAALSPGVLGSASSTQNNFAFSSFRTALTADTVSADDTTFTSNLPGGSSFDMHINHVLENGGATFLDDDGGANNSQIRMTRANAKAIGLVGATDSTIDAQIKFSSSFAWDFDRSDGIDGSQYDFIGVAAHEIGHALGFTSGIDVLDNNADAFSDDAFTFVSPVDLTKYSQASADDGVIDWTADTHTKYWSLDGGQNAITGATFSTGRNFGDGQQNSHWKDNQGLGLLDPTIANGELGDITDTDRRMFDVIGWDLASPLSSPSTTPLASGAGGGAVPEPVVLGHVAVALILLYTTGRPIARRREVTGAKTA